MIYKIMYADGKCCNFANSRKDLLEWLKLLKDETISDIRKLYKNGVSDSVLEKYEKFIQKAKSEKKGDEMFVRKKEINSNCF